VLLRLLGGGDGQVLGRGQILLPLLPMWLWGCFCSRGAQDHLLSLTVNRYRLNSLVIFWFALLLKLSATLLYRTSLGNILLGCPTVMLPTVRVPLPSLMLEGQGARVGKH
jgi:uncharacterized membrane protein